MLCRPKQKSSKSKHKHRKRYGVIHPMVPACLCNVMIISIVTVSRKGLCLRSTPCCRSLRYEQDHILYNTIIALQHNGFRLVCYHCCPQLLTVPLRQTACRFYTSMLLALSLTDWVSCCCFFMCALLCRKSHNHRSRSPGSVDKQKSARRRSA